MAFSTPLDDCTIVWLCPLEVELRAAIAMLDKVSDECPPRARGQNVVYTIGEIGPHKVAVVGYYQEQGLAASGSIVAEVLRDLRNLQFGLLVGIAGGIPSSTHDMQLGDVAVAVPEGDRPGVVGYDFGKKGDGDLFQLKHWQNSTHPLLRSVISKIRAHDEVRFRRHLQVLDRLPEFRRPESVTLPLTSVHPKVHYGTILSGNTVIKSKTKRDELRQLYGSIAVEMEAAGMMTRLPVAVIRGISDFADSSKDDKWQPYAAITAAAYAKEVLLCLPSEHDEDWKRVRRRDLHETRSTPFADQDLRLAQVLPEKSAFVGRTEEMAFLEEELGFRDLPPIQRSVVCLWGLTGVGKSQLAARFVSQQRLTHPKREIFWINGESPESFERSVTSMLKSLDNSVAASESAHLTEPSDEKRSRLVNLFFAELNGLEDARWLLVIDGVNGTTPRSAAKDSVSSDVHSCFGRLDRGYVLLTSRRRDIVEKYHPSRELKGLKVEDAVSLLQLRIHPQLMEGAEDLVGLLKGLPLALCLATSVISRYRCSVKEYLEMWKSCSQASEIMRTDETLYRSMELSFEELEKADPIAAKILTLFSFLHHRDLWYDLCYNATDDTYPTWLQDLAKEKKPFRHYYPLLADMSFIELRISPNGDRMWETHPAIQVVARQRAKASEQEYIRCAISLVASEVPRSFEANAWETIRRLGPHVELCWGYVKRGGWGSDTNLTDLESLGHVFRHIGRYSEASLIYRMIEHGLSLLAPSRDNTEFLADVLTNLGLVYTRQRKYELALKAFDRSRNLMIELDVLTPSVSMSIMYNKAVVYMMTEKLDEAESLLQNAASLVSEDTTDGHTLKRNERKGLYLRILNDLGEVSLRKGSGAAALKFFQDVYDSQRSWQSELHPTLYSLKLNMGRALTKLGRFAEARVLLLEVIAVYTEWWGRHHPETMRAIDELAWAFMEEGKGKQATNETGGIEIQTAEELWTEVLNFYQSTDGDGSDMVTRIEANLQYLYSLKPFDRRWMYSKPIQ